MKILKVSVFLLFLTINAHGQDTNGKNDNIKPGVTFIELGSVKCIPCQKMQAVIKQVEEKYPTQVKTIFYDVWTKEGKPYAEKYHIDLIPTQVFLNDNGKEYYRHEGYFPFDELDKIIQLQLK